MSTVPFAPSSIVCFFLEFWNPGFRFFSNNYSTDSRAVSADFCSFCKHLQWAMLAGGTGAYGPRRTRQLTATYVVGYRLFMYPIIVGNGACTTTLSREGMSLRSRASRGLNALSSCQSYDYKAALRRRAPRPLQPRAQCFSEPKPRLTKSC